MKDTILVTVNQEEMTLGSWMAKLKFSGMMPKLQADMVKDLLIHEAARNQGISITEQELRAGINELRQKMKLYTSEHTIHWLDQNKMTVDDLESYVKMQLLEHKFKDIMSEGKIESYFAENKQDFESAEISQIVVSDEQLAIDLKRKIAQGNDTFDAFARKFSIDQYKDKGGYIGEVQRDMLKPEFESVIFEAKQGEIVGPLSSNLGYHIIIVHTIHMPKLHDKIVEKIKNNILQNWLTVQFDQAQISFEI